MNKPINTPIHCNDCSISQLCVPFSLSNTEMDKLDSIINRKRPFQKGQFIFNAGQKLSSLYAVRSGSFKSYIVTEDGSEKITGFHLAGDLIGFDAINDEEHPSFAIALETSMICEIPYDTLELLSGQIPKLRHQLFRLMSNEIKSDQELFLLLSSKTAEERMATFIHSLSVRFQQRGLSNTHFRLPMTRTDMGNYLGLTVETVSRLISKFHKLHIINVNGKEIEIKDLEQLKVLAQESN
ncbi:fumarate/nitrate reduction transcriptional regulator Fnr [Vibrio sp.]|nr:fumarate/nitrate reduction transcriptional regulator Fnr [Vibrio sp.]